MKLLTRIVLFLAIATASGAERKIIQPEGYNQGLPFTPGILIDGTLYIAGFSGEDPKTGIVGDGHRGAHDCSKMAGDESVRATDICYRRNETVTLDVSERVALLNCQNI